jgi:prepilin-type N-terminal cleavage/methylation domain-containing protein
VNKKRGITLIELMVVTAIMGGLVALLVDPIRRIMARYQTSQKMIALQQDAPVLQAKFESYFWRAMGMEVLQSGTSYVGYNIIVNGAIVLDANLGPCNTFNPQQNNNPARKRQVEIVCCTANQTQTMPTPSNGTMTIVSACRSSGGLSIVERSGVGVTSSTCYPGYFEMNLIPMGISKASGLPIMRLDLYGNVDEKADYLERRGLGSMMWSTTVTLGNTANNLLVSCF